VTEAQTHSRLLETPDGVFVRHATTADAAACAEIYRPYVEQTAFTFETIAPDADEVSRRMVDAQRRLAWVVAEREGETLGYAYAHEFNSRHAYDWTCEMSVYVSMHVRRGGVGRAMYAALLPVLAERGQRRALANVVSSNEASIRMHERAGFHQVGRFERIGYKHGEWHDVTWLQRDL
jgi:phosphinothricin acetyltransferase